MDWAENMLAVTALLASLSLLAIIVYLFTQYR